MKRNSTHRKSSRDARGRFLPGSAAWEKPAEPESPVKPAAVNSATAARDKVAGRDRQGCRSISTIIMVLREIFPAKTDLEIALRTGVNQRTAERWLSGNHVMTAESLVDLLRSDIGGELLGALMGGAHAPWWRDFHRHLDVARLAKSHADTGRRLARILAGDAEG